MSSTLIKEIRAADREVLVEPKGKDIVVKSKDRNETKVKIEKHLKKKGYLFKSVFKKAKSNSIDVLEISGGGDIIFKPVIRKGQGGVAFEKELSTDIANYLNGVDYNKLKHPDVLKEMEKVIGFNRKKKYAIVEEGSKNKKRQIKFDGSKLVILNSDGPTLTDLTLVEKNTSPEKKLYLSLKMSPTYYIMNAGVGQYFAEGGTKIKINEYFGFDGQRMGGFGKEFACVTKKNVNYTKVSQNLADILAVGIGVKVVIIHKKTANDVMVSVNKNTNRVSITGLSKDSYVYPEPGRKYANIKVKATINGHKYEVHFQFRGTKPTDKGPRYLRVLLKRL
jgi:hypothetical protein